MLPNGNIKIESPLMQLRICEGDYDKNISCKKGWGAFVSYEWWGTCVGGGFHHFSSFFHYCLLLLGD
jgi:hypothetical protein